jgi:hypothetical protein
VTEKTTQAYGLGLIRAVRACKSQVVAVPALPASKPDNGRDLPATVRDNGTGNDRRPNPARPAPLAKAHIACLPPNFSSESH